MAKKYALQNDSPTWNRETTVLNLFVLLLLVVAPLLHHPKIPDGSVWQCYDISKAC